MILNLKFLLLFFFNSARLIILSAEGVYVLLIYFLSKKIIKIIKAYEVKIIKNV